MWKTNFDIFNNIYVSSLDIVNSIYVRVFVRILHLAATSMGVKHEGTMKSSFVCWKGFGMLQHLCLQDNVGF